MNRFLITLQILGVRSAEYFQTQCRTVRSAVKGDPEKGSVTIEQVAWAVFAIVIVAVVATAIRSYVDAQVSQIK